MNQRYVNWIAQKIKDMEYKREGMFASISLLNRIQALPASEREARRELLKLCVRRLVHYRDDETKQSLAPHNYGGAHYQTQKAMGIAMTVGGRSMAGIDTAHYSVILPYDFFEFRSVNVSAPKKIFARPAPTRPRHGFVESREVNGYADLLELYQETLLADTDGEIIIMERLEGLFSAVASNAGITWGTGHDGVTGGSNGLFVPVNVGVTEWNNATAGNYPDQIGIKNVCYVEIVQNTNTVGEEISAIVQRRDGPAQKIELDYIPRQVTVETILKPSHYGNLMDWEAVIKKHSGNPNVVMRAPGMPLSSHYAVHAIEHGIPVITTQTVEVGQTFSPSVSTLAPLTDADAAKLVKYTKHWSRQKITAKQSSSAMSQSILATSIGTIHAMSRWDNKPHLLNLRAFGVTMMLRYLHSALAGELRHWHMHGPGKGYDDDGNRIELENRKPRTKLKRDRRVADTRLAVYVQYLKPYSIRSRLESLNSIYEDFGEGGWDSSYGGKNWQNVAMATIGLAKSLIEFQAKGSAAAWRDVVVAANTALHTAHNNGLAVTKWMQGSHVTRLAQVPTLGFMNPIAARVVLNQPLSGSIQEVNYDDDNDWHFDDDDDNVRVEPMERAA